eukprot:Sspe_Gene.102341::Locus_77422_Transcript_1_1_Confidence_1.000_Length_1378::g.102341::m.102341
MLLIYLHLFIDAERMVVPHLYQSRGGTSEGIGGAHPEDRRRRRVGMSDAKVLHKARAFLDASVQRDDKPWKEWASTLVKYAYRHKDQCMAIMKMICDALEDYCKKKVPEGKIIRVWHILGGLRSDPYRSYLSFTLPRILHTMPRSLASRKLVGTWKCDVARPAFGALQLVRIEAYLDTGVVVDDVQCQEWIAAVAASDEMFLSGYAYDASALPNDHDPAIEEALHGDSSGSVWPHVSTLASKQAKKRAATHGGEPSVKKVRSDKGKDRDHQREDAVRKELEKEKEKRDKERRERERERELERQREREREKELEEERERGLKEELRKERERLEREMERERVERERMEKERMRETTTPVKASSWSRGVPTP